MRTLKELIAEKHDPLIVHSIYDGISALLVRDSPFQAAYIGSHATGATRYGIPDIGYIGLEDMADQVRRLAPIAEVPIIVDGEAGWGNPLHVARAVRELERAGAAATHIEDHDFGKHITAKPHVIPVDKALDKYKAALDARASDDFLIIARTDAAGIEGPEAAVDRALAYQEAGVDGIYIAAYLDDESYKRYRTEAKVPIYAIDFPKRSAADHAAKAADVLIYFALAHLAATAGMRSAFQVLAEKGSTVSLEERLGYLWDYDAFLGIEQARKDAQAYGVITDPVPLQMP